MRPDGRPSGPGVPRSARVFFALYPPEAATQMLAEAGQALLQGGRGRLIPRKNLHLTLAFLGDLPLDRLTALEAVGARVAHATSGFELKLDQMGCWSRKGILWASCRQAPVGLLALESELLAGLRDAGLPAPPDQRPFKPHVTLARHFSGGISQLQEGLKVCWPCDRFFLVRSRLDAAGSNYHTLASWPLELSS